MNTKLRFSILLSITYLFISTSLINAQWEPDPYSRSLDTSNDNVHVVWHDFRQGNWEIYYKRASDRGTTWSGDIRYK